MVTGTVDQVTLIERVQGTVDCCKIRIDFDDLYIFGKYEELCDFIGKRVSYDTRSDVYNGRAITVVANLAEIYKIQVLDKTTNIRLVPENSEDRVGCNFTIDSLKYGDRSVNCVAFLSSAKPMSSARSEWVDCVMVDKKSKVFEMRIFTRNADSGDIDPTEAVLAKVGRYVKFNLEFTQFGYQAKSIELVDTPVLVPPEVEVAIRIILGAVEEDKELKQYMEYYKYIETLRNVIDVEFGYHLVKIASEISMINALENISDLYDSKTLIRAAITSRGYLLPAKTKFSRPILNITKVMRTDLQTCRELLLILDPASEEESSPTKRMYMEISAFACKVVDERRGISEEISERINLSDLRRKSGGLF